MTAARGRLAASLRTTALHFHPRGEQTVVLFLHHGIALTTSPFERCAVQHGDATALVVNEFSPVQAPAASVTPHGERRACLRLSSGHHKLVGRESIQTQQ